MQTLIKIAPLLAGVSFACSQPGVGEERPDIIVILSDDIGFSDLGCYGGEINTPHLDYLAENGIRFSQFYNGARCCPSRAALLTGIYPHQAGVGYMTARLGNTPSYQGYLREDKPTIAEILQDGGYTTLHVGKWHVGGIQTKSMPSDRGFERAWTTMERVNYWILNEYYQDGEVYSFKEEEKKYLTDLTGDKALEFIDYALEKDNPYFLYLSFNAAHWPLHAHEEDIARYRGKFMEGWDVLRERRTERLIQMGMIDPVSLDINKDPDVPHWDDIPAGDAFPGYHPMTSEKHDQDDWDWKMSVYAAQIESMDMNIGRVLKRLEEAGRLKNTLIIYVQDNGGCAEGIGKNDTADPGTPESYIAYGMPWADLSNTPFKMYKHFLHEGGIATPGIFYWPEGINHDRKGIIERESMGHLIDIAPTCFDAAGIDISNTTFEPEGQSLMPVLNGFEANSDRKLFWEHEGNRAFRRGDWKIVSRYVNDYRYFSNWEFPKAPREQEWELYNVRKDRFELNELSEHYPDLLLELKQEYQEWYDRVGAIPREELIIGTRFDF
jgi:arylsulfatase A-like enzyme